MFGLSFGNSKASSSSHLSSAANHVGNAAADVVCAAGGALATYVLASITFTVITAMVHFPPMVLLGLGTLDLGASILGAHSAVYTLEKLGSALSNLGSAAYELGSAASNAITNTNEALFGSDTEVTPTEVTLDSHAKDLICNDSPLTSYADSDNAHYVMELAGDDSTAAAA